jgi:hypothetical protein
MGEGWETGSNRSILLDSAALISLFLFFPMPRQPHDLRSTMTGFC